MTEVGIRGVEMLQDRMQKAQESLKDVDENIKKLTGRSPGEFRGGRRGRGGPIGRPGRDSVVSRVGDDREHAGDGRARLFNVARRSLGGAPFGGGGMGRDRIPDRRRSGGQRYNKDSDDEDFGRPSGGLSSSVRQSVVEVPSREESLSKQKTDKKGLARNKRMFGLLLGTLQKFKADSSQGDKTKKRQEIEDKLEQKAKDEKAEIYRQKQELWDARRQKTRELRQLETKLELVENHQIWEKETVKMKNFLRTETKPYIFWLPKDHVPETLRKHASSKKAIDALIEERKQEMEKDIEALLDERTDDKTHADEDHHSDMESPEKRRRHSSKEEGSDLDEAMKDADPDMTVTVCEEMVGNSGTVSGEKQLDANDDQPEDSVDVSVSGNPVTQDDKEEAMDMAPLESEQMHLETAEALTGQPAPSQVDTVPIDVTSENMERIEEESMNTEDNSVDLPPLSNHGEEQVVPEADQP